MASDELTRTVVVFDLDDTLYKEAEYRASGLRAVCRFVDGLYGTSLIQWFESVSLTLPEDPLTEICRLAGLPEAMKSSLLWVYRLHFPDISLPTASSVAIAGVQALGADVIVLTDGRSVSQRHKLKALGLSGLPVYISEEYGSEKPETLRFKLVMKEFPCDRYVYVADNPRKDFIAPNALGWQTICLRGDGRNIHPQELDGLDEGAVPDCWIDSLETIFAVL